MKPVCELASLLGLQGEEEPGVRSPEIDPSPRSVTDCPDVALDLTFSLSELWSKATVLQLSLTMSPFPSPAREVVTSVPSGGIL